MLRFESFVTAALASCLLLLATAAAQPPECLLDADPGPCDGIFPRYYYDATEGVCKEFTYGGCGGNANNFKTTRECQAACDADICSLKPDPGPCEALITRYYYNVTEGVCKEFTYGGCKGNANNFETPQECQIECFADICSLKPDPGPCRALITRYYYGPAEGVCKEFTYGGCLGNANNFEDPQHCEAKCAVDVCSLDADPGPCKALFSRYYYDADMKVCKTFIYGGCKGNGNNFESLKECQDACSAPY